jgi:hypothetical protein
MAAKSQSPQHRRRSLVPAAVLSILLLSVLAPPGRAQVGVHVALTPADSTVTPGDVLELDLTVTQAGSGFNGFDAIVSYDTLALTFLPASPISDQEGAMMQGACGNTFHLFQHAPGKLTITDILLCNNDSLTGPGQIYRLRFRASITPQTTWIRFQPPLLFYNAGFLVAPLDSTPARVRIGSVVGTGGAPSGHLPAPTVAAATNPVRGGVELRISSPDPGVQRLRVCDLAGRTIRRVDDGRFGAGSRSAYWNGRDDQGNKVPAGVYWLYLEANGRLARGRVVLLK